ncbi:MAG TPA: hypothetical protein VFD06_06410 [Candidatus Polarisedimenticolia bacterium]|nr:hypothetical protein [Candidatus Polarisedimenticolia bacterium]
MPCRALRLVAGGETMPISKNAVLLMSAVLALVLCLPGIVPAAEPDGAAAGSGTVNTVPPETPTAPPKNLRKVGDHWTPWAPPDPESFPPGATVHVIVPGETLWDLSDLTYNNPYLWPQLWNENRYILDSHWIYPGDPLLLPPRPMVVSGPGAVPTEIVPQDQEGAPHTDLGPMQDGSEGPEGPLQAETPAQPGPSTPAHGQGDGFSSGRLVDWDDLRCSGYITEDSKRGELFIAENEEPGYQTVTLGSLVYLNKGKKDERLQPGAKFTIVEHEGKVLHPITDRTQGIYTKRLGELRVLKVLDDTALATVTFACDEMRVGDELETIDLKEVPQGPVPPFDRLRLERNGKPTGYVIHTKDLAVRVATGDIVSIDLGSEDGISPGVYLTAFAAVGKDRLGHMPEYHFKYQNEIFTSADLHWDEGHDEFPSLPIAQIIVMTTEPHTATAKVIYSLREMSVGTMVEVD